MELKKRKLLESKGFELIRSSWKGGDYRELFSDGLEEIVYKSETGLLHQFRDGIEYEVELAEDGELYELV